MKPMLGIFWLMIVLGVLGLIFIASQPEHTQEHETQTAPTHKNDSSEQGQTVGEKSNRSRWAEYKKKIEENEKVITALSTVFIAAFTVVLAFATGFLYLATRDLVEGADRTAEEQARDMKESIAASMASADAAKKAADVAEDSLVVSQRPWIFAEQVSVRDKSFVEGGALLLPITIKLKNTGNTPAIDVWPVVSLMDVGVSDMGPAGRQSEIIMAGPGGGSIAIFPGATFDVPVYAVMDVTEVLNSKRIIWPWVVGCVFYRLKNGGELHHTGFIYNTFVIRDDPKDYLFPPDLIVSPNELRLQLSPQGAIAD